MVMMNSINGIFFSVFLFVLLIPSDAFCQLYDYKGSAQAYRSTGYGSDTMFVFFSDQQQKIMAASHSTGDTADFLWKHFDQTTKSFDSLFIHKNTYLSRVELDSLYAQHMLNRSAEGLRVEIRSDQHKAEAYNAWVIMDTLPDFGEIEIEENDCEKMWFAVDRFELQDYVYYNWTDTPAVTMELYNSRDVLWESSADVDIFDAQTLYNYGDYLIGKIGTPFGMPYKDADYYLTVSNVFGNSRSDTIYDVEAKAVKADFKVQKIPNGESPEDYSEDQINEALLHVTFKNESENAQYYDWVGFNDSLNILNGKDSILWTSKEEVPMDSEIWPYRPGKFPVRLTVHNDYGCYDSTTFYHIKVDSSKIDSTLIPNVFTPDGNGMNDYFVIPKKSIVDNGKRGVVSMKWLHVSVFNRSGELVYRFEGDPEGWSGWNGKVRDSNRDAAEGIYLYVIRGMGYDGVLHENKQYSGFLYLFR
jgi:hypothetical protein